MIETAARIDVEGTLINARLRRPEAEGEGACPAVLLCSGYPGEGEAWAPLMDQIAGIFNEVGLAVATFEPRTIEEGMNAGATVDDASAVFRWLLLQEGIDPSRVGVLGYSSGGIVAAALSGRTDQLGSLCLLAPLATPEMLQRLEAARAAGGPAEQLERICRSLEELRAVDAVIAHDRRTIVVHAAADRIVPAGRAQTIVARLQEASRHVEHLIIARGDHSLSGVEARVACLEQLVSFFDAMPQAA